MPPTTSIDSSNSENVPPPAYNSLNSSFDSVSFENKHEYEESMSNMSIISPLSADAAFNLRLRYAQLRADRDSYQLCLQQQNHALKVLQIDYSIVQTAKDKLELDRDALTHEVDNFKTQKNNLGDENENLKCTKDRLTGQLRTYRNESQEIRDQLQKKVENLENRLSKTNLLYENAERRKTSQARSYEAAKSETKELKYQLELVANTEKISVLVEQNKRLTGEREQFQKAVTANHQSTQRATQVIRALQVKCTTLAQELEVVKTEKKEALEKKKPELTKEVRSALKNKIKKAKKVKENKTQETGTETHDLLKKVAEKPKRSKSANRNFQSPTNLPSKLTRDCNSPVHAEVETVSGRFQLERAKTESLEIRQNCAIMVDKCTSVEKNVITHEIGINHRNPMVDRYCGVNTNFWDRVSDFGVQVGISRVKEEAAPVESGNLCRLGNLVLENTTVQGFENGDCVSKSVQTDNSDSAYTSVAMQTIGNFGASVFVQTDTVSKHDRSSGFLTNPVQKSETTFSSIEQQTNSSSKYQETTPLQKLSISKTRSTEISIDNPPPVRETPTSYSESFTSQRDNTKKIHAKLAANQEILNAYTTAVSILTERLNTWEQGDYENAARKLSKDGVETEVSAVYYSCVEKFSSDVVPVMSKSEILTSEILTPISEFVDASTQHVPILKNSSSETMQLESIREIQDILTFTTPDEISTGFDEDLKCELQVIKQRESVKNDIIQELQRKLKKSEDLECEIEVLKSQRAAGKLDSKERTIRKLKRPVKTEVAASTDSIDIIIEEASKTDDIFKQQVEVLKAREQYLVGTVNQLYEKITNAEKSIVEASKIEKRFKNRMVSSFSTEQIVYTDVPKEIVFYDVPEMEVLEIYIDDDAQTTLDRENETKKLQTRLAGLKLKLKKASKKASLSDAQTDSLCSELQNAGVCMLNSQMDSCDLFEIQHGGYNEVIIAENSDETQITSRLTPVFFDIFNDDIPKNDAKTKVQTKKIAILNAKIKILQKTVANLEKQSKTNSKSDKLQHSTCLSISPIAHSEIAKEKQRDKIILQTHKSNTVSITDNTDQLAQLRKDLQSRLIKSNVVTEQLSEIRQELTQKKLQLTEIICPPDGTTKKAMVKLLEKSEVVDCELSQIRVYLERMKKLELQRIEVEKTKPDFVSKSSQINNEVQDNYTDSVVSTFTLTEMENVLVLETDNCITKKRDLKSTKSMALQKQKIKHLETELENLKTEAKKVPVEISIAPVSIGNSFVELDTPKSTKFEICYGDIRELQTKENAPVPKRNIFARQRSKLPILRKTQHKNQPSTSSQQLGLPQSDDNTELVKNLQDLIVTNSNELAKLTIDADEFKSETKSNNDFVKKCVKEAIGRSEDIENELKRLKQSLISRQKFETRKQKSFDLKKTEISVIEIKVDSSDEIHQPRIEVPSSNTARSVICIQEFTPEEHLTPVTLVTVNPRLSEILGSNCTENSSQADWPGPTEESVSKLKKDHTKQLARLKIKNKKQEKSRTDNNENSTQIAYPETSEASTLTDFYTANSELTAVQNCLTTGNTSFASARSRATSFASSVTLAPDTISDTQSGCSTATAVQNVQSIGVNTDLYSDYEACIFFADLFASDCIQQALQPTTFDQKQPTSQQPTSQPKSLSRPEIRQPSPLQPDFDPFSVFSSFIVENSITSALNKVRASESKINVVQRIKQVEVVTEFYDLNVPDYEKVAKGIVDAAVFCGMAEFSDASDDSTCVQLKKSGIKTLEIFNDVLDLNQVTSVADFMSKQAIVDGIFEYIQQSGNYEIEVDNRKLSVKSIDVNSIEYNNGRMPFRQSTDTAEIRNELEFQKTASKITSQAILNGVLQINSEDLTVPKTTHFATPVILNLSEITDESNILENLQTIISENSKDKAFQDNETEVLKTDFSKLKKENAKLVMISKQLKKKLSGKSSPKTTFEEKSVETDGLITEVSQTCFDYQFEGSIFEVNRDLPTQRPVVSQYFDCGIFDNDRCPLILSHIEVTELVSFDLCEISGSPFQKDDDAVSETMSVLTDAFSMDKKSKKSKVLAKAKALKKSKTSTKKFGDKNNISVANTESKPVSKKYIPACEVSSVLYNIIHAEKSSTNNLSIQKLDHNLITTADVDVSSMQTEYREIQADPRHSIDADQFEIFKNLQNLISTNSNELAEISINSELVIDPVLRKTQVVVDKGLGYVEIIGATVETVNLGIGMVKNSYLTRTTSVVGTDIQMDNEIDARIEPEDETELEVDIEFDTYFEKSSKQMRAEVEDETMSVMTDAFSMNKKSKKLKALAKAKALKKKLGHKKEDQPVKMTPVELKQRSELVISEILTTDIIVELPDKTTISENDLETNLVPVFNQDDDVLSESMSMMSDAMSMNKKSKKLKALAKAKKLKKVKKLNVDIASEPIILEASSSQDSGNFAGKSVLTKSTTVIDEIHESVDKCDQLVQSFSTNYEYQTEICHNPEIFSKPTETELSVQPTDSKYFHFDHVYFEDDFKNSEFVKIAAQLTADAIFNAVTIFNDTIVDTVEPASLNTVTVQTEVEPTSTVEISDDTDIIELLRKVQDIISSSSHETALTQAELEKTGEQQKLLEFVLAQTGKLVKSSSERAQQSNSSVQTESVLKSESDVQTESKEVSEFASQTKSSTLSESASQTLKLPHASSSVQTSSEKQELATQTTQTQTIGPSKPQNRQKRKSTCQDSYQQVGLQTTVSQDFSDLRHDKPAKMLKLDKNLASFEILPVKIKRKVSSLVDCKLISIVDIAEKTEQTKDKHDRGDGTDNHAVFTSVCHGDVQEYHDFFLKIGF